ncbi:type 1 glutamine amidotransferase domain-containing protein [Cellulomonas palmilytica]|uniref:type 1 glutamine amidotransferase domain-containing protein n=1 Tax=Cellulomonas palmilytica TaxID=2608402 RepID=UPI001F34A0E9|nr:type 1 glutamine amidotransferase domain-containing protein [Cellulomonas palmilytica]UJP39645.1 type 1 glutamine amidotransferase [Cellulomonas palmilytica]
MSLEDRTVAFLLTDGFEDSELTSPWAALTDAGARASLVSPTDVKVVGKNGYEQNVDLPVATADAADFDALVLPGGVVNADDLRLSQDAVRFVRAFVDAGKPVGVICHGAWVLVEADAVRGRRLTSYPSLRTDLTNAGADWVDEQVVVDGPFVSSRTPDDLPAFDEALVEAVGAAG